MLKRTILGIVVVLSALAAQDGLLGAKPGISSDPRASTAQMGGNEPLTQNKALFPLVTRVIDGDTIVVVVNGVSEKIRLIGVDTPETVDPRKQVECFGKEASALTKTLLLNTSVIIEADATQGDRDKYGRLLRYVFLKDGTLINEKIISLGYGHEYTYRTPYKYQAQFNDAERSAREAQKGLWAPEACKNS